MHVVKQIDDKPLSDGWRRRCGCRGLFGCGFVGGYLGWNHGLSGFLNGKSGDDLRLPLSKSWKSSFWSVPTAFPFAARTTTGTSTRFTFVLKVGVASCEDISGVL
jgi:hypothetical protein